MERAQFFSKLIFLVFFINACNSNNPESTTVETVLYENTQTVIASDDGVIERPSNLVQIHGERMYVLDYGRLEILEISAEGGKVVNSFGRKGKGPGELTLSSNLLKNNDKIILHNTKRASLSFFSPEGDFESTVPLNIPISLSADMAVYKDWILMSALEKDNGIVDLASLKDLSENRISLGDTTIGNLPTSVNFDEYNSAIRNGEVPKVFKDDVLTLFDEKANIYLVYHAENRVQKYSNLGELLWDKKVPFPESDLVFESFIEANTNNTFNRIISLRYFTEANHYEDRLYLLVTLNDKKSSFILVIDDESGVVEKRIEFSGLDFDPTGFAYHPLLDAFFFIDRQGPALVKVTKDNG